MTPFAGPSGSLRNGEPSPVALMGVAGHRVAGHSDRKEVR